MKSTEEKNREDAFKAREFKKEHPDWTWEQVGEKMGKSAGYLCKVRRWYPEEQAPIESEKKLFLALKEDFGEDEEQADDIIPDDELLAVLESANSLCRSAMEIAKRNGRDTDWEAFRYELSKSLELQGSVLFPIDSFLK